MALLSDHLAIINKAYLVSRSRDIPRMAAGVTERAPLDRTDVASATICFMDGPLEDSLVSLPEENRKPC